jgi:dephospho-CoA kinase
MLRVGLTGNIASGKSTASSIFALLGAHVLDADRLAHGLLRAGTNTYARIVEAFGRSILNENGEIERKRLGTIVFADAAMRSKLNAITHPEVEAAIEKHIRDLDQSTYHGIVIVDAALIVETGGYRMYDRLIVVTCSPALQISRIMSRDGLTEADARARMASQMPIAEKLKLANYVIDTSGTMKQTHDQVEGIYRDLMAQAPQMNDSMKSS